MTRSFEIEKHRLTRGSFFYAWSNMKRRCNKTTGQDSKNYFQRGIKYDPNWETFKGFYDDMSYTYDKGLTLDRIDNDQGYSKSNCRWATRKVQNNNTRVNRRITYKGDTKTFAQWCELSDAKSSTIRQRFYVYKWTFERALGFRNESRIKS